MALNESKYIWMNGEFVEWQNATVHVLTHSLHYGNAVFEGIRAYKLADGGTAVFRLREHMERLVRSAEALCMKVPYTVDELCDATLELIARCGLESAYIRPLVYHGYGEMGIYTQNCKVDVSIACWTWDSYLGEEALAQGIDAGVSSWRQRSANEMPPAVKSAGNYLNSGLAKMEAVANGFGEAILLNQNGFVTEGSGENLFVIKDGIIMTPPTSDGILSGITRQTIFELVFDSEDVEGEEPLYIMESSMLRTDLYNADEAFFTGTAAELTPIRSVDHRAIPCPGKITQRLQKMYFDAVRGKDERHEHWLSRVEF